MKTMAKTFKALSEETRLDMLALLLYYGELCVCDFVGVLEITQSKASRHLRYLVNAGLLEDRRSANWVYYRVEANSTEGELFLPFLKQLLEQRAEILLGRLERWLETKKGRADTCFHSEPLPGDES